MIVDAHAHYGAWLSSSEADTPERFSAILDSFEIRATVVSSARAILYDIISGNAEVADLLEKEPRAYGAIVVNPNHRAASLAELSRHGQNDRFVAAKLHPDYCGVATDSPANMAIYRRLLDMDMPLVVHTWGLSGVEAAASAARAFPDLRIVMFHMGADAWRTAAQRACEYANLWLETASTVSEPSWIRDAVAIVGARKVLFGTDMTLLTPAWALGAARAAGLDKDDFDMVMGRNAIEFFGLPPTLE